MTLPLSQIGDIKRWDNEQVVQRVLELEQELFEYQESSRDLETALEEELKQLELDNARLLATNNTQAQTINQLKNDIKGLKRLVSQKDDTIQDWHTKYDTDMFALKQKIVDIEITNDTMESNDRILQQKITFLTQFNGELLEKIAILENDLHLEKTNNNENRLKLSNYENIHNRTQSKLPPELEIDDDQIEEAEVLMLSMKAILRDGPPSKIPKSESLKRINEIRQKRGQHITNMTNNLQSFRNSGYFISDKSPAGAKISHQSFTSVAQPPRNVTNILHTELKKHEPSRDELKRKNSIFRLFRPSKENT